MTKSAYLSKSHGHLKSSSVVAYHVVCFHWRSLHGRRLQAPLRTVRGVTTADGLSAESSRWRYSFHQQAGAILMLDTARLGLFLIWFLRLGESAHLVAFFSSQSQFDHA